jgi:hypothetical protein
MKTEHMTPLKQRTNDSTQETSISSMTKNTIQSNNHKPNQKLRSMLLIGVTVASSISLSSCVEPYGSTIGGISNNPYTAYERGYQINTLPRGYQSETVSGSTYFYHDGNYYRRSSNGYVVTDAPRSSRYYNEYARMRQTDNRNYRDNVTLPRGYRTENISGSTYYYHNGKYYRRSTNGYMEIDAPRNSRYYGEYSRLHQNDPNVSYDRLYDQRSDLDRVITRLPQGYELETHRGIQYYKVGGRYYIPENGAYSRVTTPY